jgi:predicted AAA+ superfamily ATPase
VDLASDYEKMIRFESAAFQRYLNEFVIFGGYPGVVKMETAENKTLLLKEIFNSYVQKDISDFLKIEDIAGFNRLVHFLAYQQTGLCKVSEISKNTRLSRYYVEKFLSSLEDTYVVSFLRPYFVNFGKAVIRAPKLYFCDTGLRNAVFGQFERLDKRRDSGALAENFIFCELLKNTDKNWLWFYRTTRGSEIDFLFVKGETIVPIEVKYGFSRQKTVPKAITSFSQRAEIEKAIVVTRDYHHEETRNSLKIFFRPCWTAFNLPGLL